MHQLGTFFPIKRQGNNHRGTEKHLQDDGLYSAGHISVFFLGTYVLRFLFFWKGFYSKIESKEEESGRVMIQYESHYHPCPLGCFTHSVTLALLSMLSYRLDLPLSAHLPPILQFYCTFLERTVFILICHIPSFHTPSSNSLSWVLT